VLLFPFIQPAYPQEKQATGDFQRVKWLIGTWVQDTAKGSVYESWSQQNDSTLLGKSYKINQMDTMVFETIKLAEKSGKLYYIPTVSNQNQGEPVKFTLVNLSDTAMVFENATHDFPQVIQYKKQGGDALLAEIRGKRGKEERTIQFAMKKLN